MLQKFKFNITLSGATLSALLVVPEEDWLYCAGVGNSKVLLLQLDRSWQMSKLSPSEAEVSDPVQVQELTVKHSPQDIREVTRIKKAGGDVRPSKVSMATMRNGEFKVPKDRIYLAGKDQPGLNLTRTIGDELAHDIGVTAEPGTIEQLYDSRYRGHKARETLIPVRRCRRHRGLLEPHLAQVSEARSQGLTTQP